MDVLRAIIRRFDEWLSRREGVFPFTDDPRVILRLQVGRASHALHLPDATIPPGSKVLILHAHNERMPHIPPAGADLAYAVRLHRLQIHSLKAVAKHILAEPRLRDIQAIGGATAHISLKEADGGRAMMEDFGFTIFPYHRPLGAFGEFWENFYTWWLIWTYNPASVRHRKMWNLQRTEFWMTKEAFLKRYA
jgi:hypothetical protein